MLFHKKYGISQELYIFVSVRHAIGIDVPLAKMCHDEMIF